MGECWYGCVGGGSCIVSRGLGVVIMGVFLFGFRLGYLCEMGVRSSFL